MKIPFHQFNPYPDCYSLTVVNLIYGLEKSLLSLYMCRICCILNQPMINRNSSYPPVTRWYISYVKFFYRIALLSLEVTATNLMQWCSVFTSLMIFWMMNPQLSWITLQPLRDLMHGMTHTERERNIHWLALESNWREDMSHMS